MLKKDLVYKKIVELNYTDGIDTKTLASILNMTRANLSHELNILYKEGKLNKSKGRPVLFFLNENLEVMNEDSTLDQLAKNNISLKHSIEQAKAAILYPPKGMNCLILGPTGVGKSMFANLMHEYAVKMNVKSENSPFIIFNCADYSNNPQLLTSQLFGVKKGAYTGSECDKIGLIEDANCGILFLDEVHRLPPEGQEALFVFLDTGKFRRVGDSESRHSDVLIVAATTEDPKSALLNTFTRRIPITITIPALKDRTFEERLYLIKSFFKHESIRLNKEIYVSLNSLRALLSYDCPSNIGQLKSDVQLLCAKAYSEFLTNIRYDVRISSRNLPSYIKQGLYKDKEHRVLWNKLIGEEIEYFRFPGSDAERESFSESSNNTIYAFLEKKLKKLKSIDTSPFIIEDILEKDISKYFEKNIVGVSDELNKKNLLTIIEPEVLECFDKIIKYVSDALNKTFDDNAYIAFALHINTLINRMYSNKPIINPHLEKIKKLYPTQFSIAINAKKIIEKYIHMNIPLDEAGYLTLFLLSENPLINEHKDKVKVIVIAHGQGTATSMADVANRLLSEDYVLAINAPLEITPSKILDKLKIIIKENPTTEGYLLLVDMGSLTTFADVIKKEFNVEIKVISLVSTLHVLEATRKSLLGVTLEHVYNDVLMVNSYVETHKNLTNKEIYKNKLLIVTACLTGEGGAIAIKDFLNMNLNYDKDLFKIICLNCLDKVSFSKKIAYLEKENEILFIVSTFPVQCQIKQYAMYEVFNVNILKELQNTIDSKTALLNIPLVLKESISNIDAFMLFNDITKFLGTVQRQLNIELSNEKTVGIILHLSFVVGRLINDEDVCLYPNKEKYITDNVDIYNIVKDNFLYLNNKYKIEICDDEICYIINLLLAKYE